MKRGFTLVEMLIVVVVLATLMTIAFRLSSVGDDQLHRNITIARMQRIENCLSGYYAAFGSYPPVKLHGSRNIYLQADGHGIQDEDGETKDDIWGWKNIGDSGEWTAWNQVQAACRAQPVACNFPFPKKYNNYVKAVSNLIKKKADSGDEQFKDFWKDKNRKAVLSAGFDDGFTDNIGRHTPNKDLSDWRSVQLFRFGLMSYLLPRYLMMLGSDKSFYTDQKSWNANNSLPCDPLTGVQYTSWTVVKDKADSSIQSDLAILANIPSQAVCARWMPNLEGQCYGGRAHTFFGITVSGGGGLSADNAGIEVYSPKGKNSTSAQYVLDSVSVRDGWYVDFFYYSPPPYQTYTLWSAGPNRRTFPPWIAREGMSSDANRCIAIWVQDDIIHMSN